MHASPANVDRSNTETARSHRNLLARFRWLAFLVVVVLTPLLASSNALAHATLDRTDPPIDGLVVTSPENITMSFTEDVANDPAPIVTILNQQGDAVPAAQISVAPGEDTRTLVVSVPELDRGTWTVSWQVTSATDGHTLSGSWAFRVGGGLPPGLATSSDASPPVWAVALRWVSFLGAAVAAGMLLFPWFITRSTMRRSASRSDDTDPTTHTDEHPSSVACEPAQVRIAFSATMAALIATLLEPVGAWLTNRDVSLTSHVRALPDDWIWRPATLIPFALFLLGMLLLRTPLPRMAASIAAAVPMASLLGLILTSHAAGRADNRNLAVLSNALHQWSVALWTGGLVALLIWFLHQRRDKSNESVDLPRVSSIALILVVIAVITGVVNTGFMMPTVNNLREDGLSLNAFSDLWSSRYGIVLLIKVLALVVPIALAAYHRRAIASLVKTAATAATSLPQRMASTLRWEVVAVLVVVIGGSTLALSSPPSRAVTSDLEQITLVAPTSLDPTDGSFLVHLTIDPASADENTISVRLTDWNGAALPSDPAPRVALGFTSLDHGASNTGVTLEPDPDRPNSFTTSGLNLSIEGWWQITATVTRSGLQNAYASFNVLLPDPNTQGSDAAPRPTSDAEAEALFNRALDRMTSWQSVRWTEQIGSGLDVMVIGDFAVIDAANDAPDAYRMDISFSGSFAPNSQGALPAAPTFDGRSSITIGEQAWLRTTNNTWLDENPTRFIVPAGWGDQYEGATNFSYGITQELDGRQVQVVTFYLPEQRTQSEAFFAWFIDVETGDVLKISMIARMHYMNWFYRDIDGDFSITSPVDAPASVATPAV